LQNHIAAPASPPSHVQKLPAHATTARRGDGIVWFEGLDAWQQAKFATKSDLNEKFKRISGDRVIGSRIQVLFKN